MAEPQRAATLPDRTVRLAARLLPAAVRDRYEREFLSELPQLSARQQTRQAFGILIRTPALRMALRAGARPAGSMPTPTNVRAPLLCRLQLNHRWVRHATTDGQRYLRCRRCGQDETGRCGNGLPPEAAVGFWPN